MKIGTSVYFINEYNSVLLAYQKAVIVGRKGYGGKLKNGEDPRKGTLREVKQETGYYKKYRICRNQDGGITFDPKDLIPVLLTDFYNGDESQVPFGIPSFRVLFFICRKYQGKAVDTKEMSDPWFYPIDNLPEDELPIGDIVFLHHLLNNIPAKVYIRRTSDLKTIIDYEVKPCAVEDLVL